MNGDAPVSAILNSLFDFAGGSGWHFRSALNTVTAANGQKALEIYAERLHEIKAVLTDLMMPKMDGVTAIRKMRNLNPNVQIIVTTGFKLSGQHAEANKLGFGVFLAKPYSVEQLLDTLESVLR